MILKHHEMWLNGTPGGDRACLEHLDLSPFDFSGKNLTCATFYGAKLRKLARANLSRTNLREADLTGADALNAVFSEAVMTGIHADGADFREADLSNSVIRSAYLSGTDFRGARMIRTNLNRSCFVGADFEKADLRFCNFHQADLTGATLDHTNLFETNFDHSNLEGTSFRNANAYRTVFHGCDFSTAIITAMNFTSAKLEGTKGLRYALCRFPTHGSRSSHLLAIATPEGVEFFTHGFRGGREAYEAFFVSENPQLIPARRRVANMLESMILCPHPRLSPEQDTGPE
ncbi:MAG: pentapeptide repeat-containing protein [Luteolibacter sp.]